MSIPGESLRLQVIKKDINKSVRGMAEIFNVSSSTMNRMLKGEQDINFTVISAVCLKLGYSANWFLFGTGEKKIKSDIETAVTEIQMLRVELDITAKLNLSLQTRLTTLENEVAELKRQNNGTDIKMGKINNEV